MNFVSFIFCIVCFSSFGQSTKCFTINLMGDTIFWSSGEIKMHKYLNIEGAFIVNRKNILIINNVRERKLNGAYKRYKKKRIILTGQYKNNYPSGTWIFYKKNGKIKKTIEYGDS